MEPLPLIAISIYYICCLLPPLSLSHMSLILSLSLLYISLSLTHTIAFQCLNKQRKNCQLTSNKRWMLIGIVMAVAAVIAYLLLRLFRLYHGRRIAEEASMSKATQPTATPDEALEAGDMTEPAVTPTSPLEASSSSGPACAVCFSTLRRDDEVRVLPCGHPFHARCLERWLSENNSCPLCRSAANPREAPELHTFEIGSPSRSGGETERSRLLDCLDGAIFWIGRLLRVSSPTREDAVEEEEEIDRGKA